MEVRVCLVILVCSISCGVLASKSVRLDPFDDDCLEAHNSYRAQHGVPPLTWSPSLAMQAQRWADELASREELRHDDAISNDEGENLAFFKPAVPKCQGRIVNNCVLCREMVKRWYDERKNYDFDSGSSKDPDGVVKHFTQLVWAGTAELGLGTAVSKRYGFITVARYKPRGNRGGVEAFISNVPPKGGPIPSLSSLNNSAPETTTQNNSATSTTPTGLGLPPQNTTKTAIRPYADMVYASKITDSALQTPVSGNSMDGAIAEGHVTGTGLPSPSARAEDKKISPLVMMLPPTKARVNTRHTDTTSGLSSELLGRELKALADELAHKKKNQKMSEEYYLNTDKNEVIALKKSALRELEGWKKEDVSGSSDKLAMLETTFGRMREVHKLEDSDEPNKDETIGNGDAATRASAGTIGKGQARTFEGPDGSKEDSYGTTKKETSGDGNTATRISAGTTGKVRVRTFKGPHGSKEDSNGTNTKETSGDGDTATRIGTGATGKGQVRTIKGPDGSKAKVFLDGNGDHAGIVFRDEIFREPSTSGTPAPENAPKERTIYVL
ncbi:cell wall protein PRY3 [Nematostella vectensis]|uniref:cell wall protein PRY3 n=1 Tax=Nematostella vectensis TaxID=45351 RepID=UPI0020771443|nr:cell wall protein PRY3 [Nematostella vectensis]